MPRAIEIARRERRAGELVAAVLRDLDILERAERGERYVNIGEIHGLSGCRVSEIAVSHGVQRRETASPIISDEEGARILAMAPTSTIAEICAITNRSYGGVRKYLDKHDVPAIVREKPPEWPAAAKRRLRELWPTRATPAEIGADPLINRSAMAVIGKAHRLNLATKPRRQKRASQWR